VIRRALSRWERACARFGASPWSSGALLLYGVAWIAAEAARGKWIGFDGFITLALGEIALASLRAINKRDIETD
jgi:hypothetical protein